MIVNLYNIIHVHHNERISLRIYAKYGVCLRAIRSHICENSNLKICRNGAIIIAYNDCHSVDKRLKIK